MLNAVITLCSPLLLFAFLCTAAHAETRAARSATRMVLSLDHTLAPSIERARPELSAQRVERIEPPENCAEQLRGALEEAERRFEDGEFLSAMETLRRARTSLAPLRALCDEPSSFAELVDFELSLRVILGDTEQAEALARAYCDEPRPVNPRPESAALLDDVCAGPQSDTRSVPSDRLIYVYASDCEVVATAGLRGSPSNSAYFVDSQTDELAIFFRCQRSGDLLWRWHPHTPGNDEATTAPGLAILVAGETPACDDLRASFSALTPPSETEIITSCRTSLQTLAVLRWTRHRSALFELNASQVPLSGLHERRLEHWLREPLATLDPHIALNAQPERSTSREVDEVPAAPPRGARAAAWATTVATVGALTASSLATINLQNAREAQDDCRVSEGPFCAQQASHDDLRELVARRRAWNIATWTTSALLGATSTLLWRRAARQRDSVGTDRPRATSTSAPDLTEEVRRQALAPPPQ